MSDTKIARRRLTEVPIGTILPHYDFDGLLSFDTDIYMYCDGSVVADADSPLNTHTLPDMSNRYLVGFGTETGGDIDTAAWPAGPETADWTVTGIAGHTINLYHRHTTDIGAFDSGGADTSVVSITDSGHVHSADGTGGFLYAKLSGESATGDYCKVARRYLGKLTSWSSDYVIGGADEWSAVAISNLHYATAMGGSTARNTTGISASHAHKHSINPPPKLSDYMLNAAQSIQPRSMRVRFIIRVK